jgi:hypothetical protein
MESDICVTPTDQMPAGVRLLRLLTSTDQMRDGVCDVLVTPADHIRLWQYTVEQPIIPITGVHCAVIYMCGTDEYGTATETKAYYTHHWLLYSSLVCTVQ